MMNKMEPLQQRLQFFVHVHTHRILVDKPDQNQKVPQFPLSGRVIVTRLDTLCFKDELVKINPRGA